MEDEKLFALAVLTFGPLVFLWVAAKTVKWWLRRRARF